MYPYLCSERVYKVTPGRLWCRLCFGGLEKEDMGRGFEGLRDLRLKD